MGLFSRKTPEEKAAAKAQREALKPFHKVISDLTGTMIGNESRPLDPAYFTELLPIKAAEAAELYLAAVPSPSEEDIKKLRKKHFGGIHQDSIPYEFRKDTHEVAQKMRLAILDAIAERVGQV